MNSSNFTLTRINIVIVMLVLVILITPAFAAEGNSGAPVFVEETTLEVKPTEGVKVTPEPTEEIIPEVTEEIEMKETITVVPTAEVKATTIPTVIPTAEMVDYVINPSSKSKLSAVSVDKIEIKAISSTGLRTLTDIRALSTSRPSVAEIEVTKGGLLKKKIVQIYPDSELKLSTDSETVMQTSSSNSSPPLELFYGLQKSEMKPWEYQFRVLKCGSGNCTVVRAEFDNRKVWLEQISESTIKAITDIPNYTALPSGVKL